MRLSEVARIVGGALRGTDVEVRPQMFIDSREAVPGGIFCAFRGESSNGHGHVAAALASGAGAALIDEPTAVAGAEPVIVVPRVQDAMGALAAHHVARLRREPGTIRVVAITGSVGKTTTKDLMAAVLPGPTVAPTGSFNNEIGLPVTASRADAGTATLVLEMGADKLGDLRYLTSLVAPDVAVVLTVGRAHLGVFGGIEATARAKRELVEGLRPGGIAVLNADDHRVRAMAASAPGPVILFGRLPSEHAVAVGARDVRVDAAGQASFTLVMPDGEAAVRLGLVGEHHVANALATAAAAHALGVQVADVASRLGGLPAASPHRMAITRRADGITVIDDSYNANPDSMAAGLRSLAALGRGGRTVAVLGAMLELGPDEATEHRAIGVLVRELGIDRLVAIGELAGLIADEVPADRVIRCADLQAARSACEAALHAGDTVLFKASNGSRVWQLADEWAVAG